MRIAFRTEGNHQQGMGDVWGAVALADEFARCGDETRFLLSGGDEACAVIAGRGYRSALVPDLDAEVAALRAFRPDVIVVNKLRNDPSYLRRIRDCCGLLVTMDDDGDGASCADLAINVLYPVAGAVMDPEYIALREEFQALHRLPRPVNPRVEALLVTQGGSDTYGFTPKIVRSLTHLRARPHVTVVLGPAFRHDENLREAAAGCPVPLTIVRNAPNMGALMVRADLAITAGGLTLFELACAGTPAVVVCGERFEVGTAHRLAQAGAAVNLGFGGDVHEPQIAQAVDALAADPARREALSLRGRALVDGCGSSRVAALIKERWARLGVARV
ncbi:MAG: hypothetical protein FJ245_05195 [Nitrospira sp.]|nr:hypothetical protein [Nitrospira sp.]